VPCLPAPDVGQRVVGLLVPLTGGLGQPGATATGPSALAVGHLGPLVASVASWLEHFHGPLAYVLCGLLVFGEAAVLIGFVLPGETAALAGGVLASLHHVNLAVMVIIVVVAAVVGDSVGYEIGKVLGPWLLQRRLVRNNPGVQRGEELLARYGGPAVFLGRWIALARALVPGLTGMSGMRYRTFLAYNAAGGVVWGTTYVLIGYAAGASYTAVAGRVGAYALAIVGALVLAVVAVVVLRRRRRRHGAPGAPGISDPPTVPDSRDRPEGSGIEAHPRPESGSPPKPG
jgi:membrane-associated protein